jgi:hypothetical protein
VIRPRLLFLLVAVAALLILPSAAQADFGIDPETLNFSFENADGTIATQAGSHPYVFKVDFELNLDGEGEPEGGELRDVIVDLPPGWVANPQAVPRCPHQLFEGSTPQCPFGTQVGVLHANVVGLGQAFGPIYNLVPPPGVPAQLGFSLINLNAFLDGSVKTEEGYKLSSLTANNPINITGAHVEIWGTPADPGHDADRGRGFENEPPHPSEALRLPFLTVPTDCRAPLQYTIEIDSKQNPGQFVSATANSLDVGGKPAALQGCDAVPFSPQIAASTTSRLAESASGLDFELKLPNQGLLAPGAIAETEPSKVEVALPEGVTANPSAAEGLATCTEAQYKAEQIDTKPGEGCPEASKLGSIVAHSPLLEEPIEGALYLAKPYENPSSSLIALYIVARAQERGVLIKQAGRVEPDPETGQLISTFEDLPPLPYSDFKLHFREGGRAPLVTPPSCGSYETTAKLTPFSKPGQPFTATSTFQIERGVSGGACPQGAPFNPGFEAGTRSNAAGSHSPFDMRLTRRDGDQDLTKLSTTLPPGLLASLVGVGKCSDAQIAQAQSRTGPHGGQEELADPSCPASSQIGHTDTGAGVGAILTYVPGNLYLAGPYNGAPLSVVAIVPGVAGPFDVGAIVVRVALRFNPLTAQAEADGSASDPIPHILKGIPLKVRDIRVHVDRPSWTFNPTSCEALATKATLWAGGANLFSSLDDSPFGLAARFQAADCANLAFKPRLVLKLKGGTKRGAHPALTGTYVPRKGDANLKGLVLRLPHSAFLDQAHIKTICTRVQYAANGGNGAGCPKGSIYGQATAYTPLLEEPLKGPVYLRSSSHNLPDFVASLHGLVDVETVARIDSKDGGIRATFANLPDAPITKVIVRMQGAKKGLIVNSTDLCARRHKADALFGGHNGRRREARPVVGAECGGNRPPSA